MMWSYHVFSNQKLCYFFIANFKRIVPVIATEVQPFKNVEINLKIRKMMPI